MIEKNEHHKIKRILSTKEDVKNYFFFKRTVELGILYSPRDLTFSQAMLYSWIKEAANV